MILRSLRLRNFRSFARAELFFDERQNYVVGGNWQGKSSLVEGIAFALFGGDAFPRRLAGAAVKAEHLLTDQATKGGVELAFSVNDREYVVRRSLPKSEVALTCDGRVVASGKRPVDEKLRDLLSVDAKFFANVFYADQDDLRKSFDLSPADRRLFIERLIGQEVWQQRVDGLRRAEKHLRQFLQDLASGRFGAFVEELDGLAEEAKEAADELRELKGQILIQQKLLPPNRKSLRGEEEKAEEKIAKLDHRCTVVETERKGLDATLRGLARGECPTCTQTVPAALRKSRLALLRQQLKAMDSELREVRRALVGLNKDLEAAGFEDAHLHFDDLQESKARYEILSREQEKRIAREKRLRGQARIFGKKPEQHQRATDEVAFLGRLSEVIDQHRAQLRGRVVVELVIVMNELLARFHDGDFDAEAVIDSDMDLNVKLHGRDVPLTNLSGAAKDMFAIAFRYGLMRVAARLVDCLILDEPTRHMDSKNVRQLKSVFDDLSDRQLVVVTIQEEFATAKGRHFTVTKDSELRSIVRSDALIPPPNDRALAGAEQSA